MILSLAIIIICGLVLSKIFNQIGLPGLLGMLLLGVIIGPYGLNLISPELLEISPDLRKIALIIILIRAGLGLKKDTLKRIGIPAVKMSFIPGLLEGFTIMLTATYLLDISLVEAGILAFVIAAVSPAVIVPQMLNLIERQRGAKKGIPTLVLAGASIDDVVAITLFSTFLGFYGGASINLTWKLLNIPISIILGIGLGVVTAWGLIYCFKKFNLRDTKKVLFTLSVALLLTIVEDKLANIISIASLLGIMTLGFIIKEKYETIAKELASKFNKIWVFAELLLFVLIGAEVNIDVAFQSGLIGITIIAIGLIARSSGVLISLINTELDIKERLFCVIAYLPKATVQAAVGAVPLAQGVESGELILALAVLAIVITAPLGAAGIKFSGERWLESNV
ncbi:MAG: cation:proton antiporter [Bacillota bacterium]